MGDAGVTPSLTERGRGRPWVYLQALLWVAGSTIVAFAAQPYALVEDEAMIYLFGIVLAALRFDMKATIFATLSSIVALDYFFIPPRFGFAATDSKKTLTFLAMIVVATVISGLSQRLRRTAWANQALYQLNVELSGAADPRQLAAIATRHLERIFGGEVLVMLRTPAGPLESAPPYLSREELALAERAWVRGDFVARWRAPGYAIWAPMRGIHEPLGVVGLKLERLFDNKSEEGLLLTACARDMATAIERMQLASAVRKSQLDAETEHMRSSLLSAVSHDLKTPLATIVAAGTTLIEHRGHLEIGTSGELLSSIVREGERLGQLIQNLLSISRLESPTIELRRTPEAVEDILSASMDRLRGALGQRSTEVTLPPDLPCVLAEPVLIEQVVTNLLENALRYTPSDAKIEIAAKAEDGMVKIQVADAGRGIPEQERDKVFEKFYRGGQSNKTDGGVGLGLTICRAIVRAHGGRIAIRDRQGGGTLVEFTLPSAPSPFPWMPPDKAPE